MVRGNQGKSVIGGLIATLSEGVAPEGMKRIVVDAKAPKEYQMGWKFSSDDMLLFLSPEKDTSRYVEVGRRPVPHPQDEWASRTSDGEIYADGLQEPGDEARMWAEVRADVAKWEKQGYAPVMGYGYRWFIRLRIRANKSDWQYICKDEADGLKRCREILEKIPQRRRPSWLEKWDI